MTLDRDNVTGVLRISGMLGIDAANSLREAILECLLRQHDATADLSEVEECDAAALQVLLAGQRNGAPGGKTLRIAGVSLTVMETAAALGFSFDESDRGKDCANAN
jgi:anti-anti-sigma regulatory factor